MIRSSRIAPLLLLPLLVAGCSSSESKLEPIASKLKEGRGRGYIYKDNGCGKITLLSHQTTAAVIQLVVARKGDHWHF
jgi:hypothetical protein